MKGIIQDPQTNIANESYALIYSPRKKGRKRYPESCVTVVADRVTAKDNQQPDKHIYAAKVYGPARSSEGVRLFYLLEWVS